MKRLLLIAISLLLLPWGSYGQNQVMSYSDFMEAVKNNHPLAKQAALAPLEAQALLRAARGGFDPKVGAQYSQKAFDNKEYYRLLDAGLKVPTWFGVEFMGGYEQNQGLFLNPEDNTPDNGLIHAGVSVALGEGLFIDKRRAELRKAELYQGMNEAEQRLLMNELMLEAGLSYWKWFQSYVNLLVFQNALELAQERFNAVKQSALLGDAPPIDTLEAGIQVQNRLLNLQQAQLDLANSGYYLSTFLWADGLIPLELESLVIPQRIDETEVTVPEIDLKLGLRDFVMAHPELIRYGFKIDQLEIQRRWKSELLKPTLDLKYNALTQRTGSSDIQGFNSNDYTFGVDFEIPLFLRKERGELRVAQLEIQDAQLDLNNKQEMMLFKARASVNDWEFSEQQYRLYTNTTDDYASLLEGERELFRSGESSLFMVNSRELGYIQAQIKLNELLAKNQIAQLKTNFSLGRLAEGLPAQ